jgi:hypothetical protein
MADEAETEAEVEDDPYFLDPLANIRSFAEDYEICCRMRIKDKEQAVAQDNDQSKTPAGASSNPRDFQLEFSRITMFG